MIKANLERFLFPALLLFPGMFSSCENELKDARVISAKTVEKPVDRSYGVEIIYSDSAKVRAKLNMPELLYFKAANPYYEMPKGVTAIFFDQKQQEQNRVRSDYAIKKENERVTELRHNVVITTRAGDTYKSDQMFWNESTRKFYSDKLLTRISKKGEIGYASSFESDENFLNPIFHHPSGDIFMPSGIAP